MKDVPVTQDVCIYDSKTKACSGPLRSRITKFSDPGYSEDAFNTWIDKLVKNIHLLHTNSPVTLKLSKAADELYLRVEREF